MDRDRPLPCALVTGARSGIGNAIMMGFLERGWRVIAVSRSAEDMENVLPDDVLSRVVIVEADVADCRNVARIGMFCPDRLDVLVHSAGMFEGGKAGYDPSSEIARVNVDAPRLLTEICLQSLVLAQGQIVFVNSSALFSNTRDWDDPYYRSKLVLREVAEEFRARLRATHVRVMSIYSGRVDTPMQEEVLRLEGRPGSRIPLLDPKRVADMVFFCLETERDVEVTDIVVRPPQRAPAGENASSATEGERRQCAHSADGR